MNKKAVLLLILSVFTITSCSNFGKKEQGYQNAAPFGNYYKNSIKMKFVRLAGGDFEMGSSPQKPGRGSDEVLHSVRISRFFMQITEVTQAQWLEVMGSNPSAMKGPDLPVENVSWEDALNFVRRLNAREGTARYRLPTEAEWEYAAGSGARAQAYGDNDLSNKAWYRINSNDRTRSVGQKQGTPWGVHDMQGNVAEWCSDWLGPYQAAGRINPKGPPTGTRRVFRGGSFKDIKQMLSTTLRRGEYPSAKNNRLGFRVVLAIE